jgi:predicted ATPase
MDEAFKAKKVVIIAGPNGAGKTTFGREFLPAEAALPVFINADLIAAGISPFDPGAAAIRAGRMMLQRSTAMRPPDGASRSRRLCRAIHICDGLIPGAPRGSSSS